MKNSLFTAALVVVFLLLAACDQGDLRLKRLEGVWRVDVEATLALDEALQELKPQEREESMAMARSLLAGMVLIFDTRKNTVTTRIGTFAEKVRLSVQSDDDNKLVVKKDEEIIEITFPDADTMLANHGGNTLMVFKRQ